MDFATVADIHAMKRQIHAYKGHGEIAVEGFNIKLGRGGIREIEFFAQTQQLIAGGRHPELRGRETLATLDILAEGGWISGKVRDELEEAYRFLRTIEHRLQMIADEQIHTLPSDPATMERFAQFCGFAGRQDFADALVARLQKVQGHYSILFEPSAVAPQPNLIFQKSPTIATTLDRLTETRFPQSAGNLNDHPKLAHRALSGLAWRIRARPTDGLHSASARSTVQKRAS